VAESADPILPSPSPRHENVARMRNSSRNPRRSASPRRTITPVQRCYRIESRNESEETFTREVDDVSGLHDNTAPTFDDRVHPDLPVDATPENYVTDVKAAQKDNTQDAFKRTTKHISQMNREAIRTIALARLMCGIYGIDASTSCDNCLDTGSVCRLFHPLLYSDAWSKINRRWQTQKVGRRACATCMVDSSVRQFCNAQYARSSD
jgi:hypothetical protein